MPRTGGVYSPPAGTKGAPGTTIESNSYNTFIDDLTADANAPRPVTAGGTGATSASAARTALGLAIGTNVQAYDALLQSIAGLTTSANQMIYLTGTDAAAVTALTAFGRSLIDDANAAAARSTLGLAAIASSGSASDLITGTLPNARVSGAYDGITTLGLTGPITVSAGGTSSVWGSGSLRWSGTSYGIAYDTVGPSPSALTLSSNQATTSANGAWMQLYGSAHAVNPGLAIITSGAGGDISIRNAGAIIATVRSDGITMAPGTDISFSGSGAATTRNSLGAASTATTISAGNGLSGGGSLAANRTLALSLASLAATASLSVPRVVVTDGTTVGSEARMDPAGFQSAFSVAGFTTSTSDTLTDYPVGQILLVVSNGNNLARNGASTVYIATNDNGCFVLAGANQGTALAGTFRNKGQFVGADGGSYTLMQKVG